MLIRFFRVSVHPTVAAGRATPAESNQIVRLMEAGIRVAAEPPVMNTVVAVSDVFPAAHTPIVVAFQNSGTGFLSRLFTHDEYCS